NIYRRFSAPRSSVHAPLIGNVAGAVRPSGCGDIKTGAIYSYPYRGGSLVVGPFRLSCKIDAERNYSSFVFSGWPGALGGRTRQKAEPVPHNLGLFPIAK